jgi:hypothetical protein
VHLLVRPTGPKRRVVDPENHMAERDRGKTERRRQAREQNPEPSAAKLQRSFMDMRSRSEQQRQHPQRQAECGIRRRPRVSEQAQDKTQRRL